MGGAVVTLDNIIFAKYLFSEIFNFISSYNSMIRKNKCIFSGTYSDNYYNSN